MRASGDMLNPTYDISASIHSLLDEPNPTSPANSLAAQLYQENRREYEKRVQAIVEQSWMGFGEDDEATDLSKPAASTPTPTLPPTTTPTLLSASTSHQPPPS
ncbi:hypothetical protein RvY_17325 [Ramazzottius varieornatus]|uniref:UBC core domain-containing protein n=1 Tax=Ramazzottius varieornatus TaxID=947166 RepID=A0A1D1W5N5_RAMVA|nr:hypothetical protein RvY_17325 [Ramazzottius varieornatus]